METRFSGTVTSAPHYFYGTHTHAEHEEFQCRRDDGTTVRIVDNVQLAPRVPVGPGDRIAVKGDEVHDPGAETVVHWTHHDPAHRHADGYIEFNGRRYA